MIGRRRDIPSGYDSDDLSAGVSEPRYLRSQTSGWKLEDDANDEREGSTGLRVKALTLVQCCDS